MTEYLRGDQLKRDDVVDDPANRGPWKVINPREVYFGERTVGVVHLITGMPQHFAIFTEFRRYSDALPEPRVAADREYRGDGPW